MADSKRSAAAKKAAETRKKKAAEAEAAKKAQEAEQAEGLSEYKPKQRPLKAAGLDQHAAHAEREAERNAEREEHNRRTGDASRKGWNH